MVVLTSLDELIIDQKSFPKVRECSTMHFDFASIESIVTTCFIPRLATLWLLSFLAMMIAATTE